MRAPRRFVLSAPFQRWPEARPRDRLSSGPLRRQRRRLAARHGGRHCATACRTGSPAPPLTSRVLGRARLRQRHGGTSAFMSISDASAGRLDAQGRPRQPPARRGHAGPRQEASDGRPRSRGPPRPSQSPPASALSRIIGAVATARRSNQSQPPGRDIVSGPPRGRGAGSAPGIAASFPEGGVLGEFSANPRRSGFTGSSTRSTEPRPISTRHAELVRRDRRPPRHRDGDRRHLGPHHGEDFAALIGAGCQLNRAPLVISPGSRCATASPRSGPASTTPRVSARLVEGHPRRRHRLQQRLRAR